MDKDNQGIEKKVDQAWKEAVTKEKAKSEEETSTAPPLGKMDFISFISTLSMQALAGLGVLPNPLTNEKEEDLNQSRYIIDTIHMLREKTKGNLTPEEAKLIDDILYELRTKFVEKVK